MTRAVSFLLVTMWSLSTSAQATTTPAPATTGSGGGIIYGLFALLAAAIIGGVVWVLLKRRQAGV